MIIYFITIFFYLFLSLFYIKRPKYNIVNIGQLGMTNKSVGAILLAALPILVILGLKDVSVGSDTISYYTRYDNADDMLTLASTRSEMGFNLFNLFLKEIVHLPWQGYLILVSSLVCLGNLLFIVKYSDDIYYSLFVYITIGLFTMNMSGIRQSLSVSICMIVLFILDYRDNIRNVKNARNKRLWFLIVSVVLLIISVTIHNSSIIFFIIFFIRKLRLTRSQVFFLLLFAIASYFYKDLLTSLIPSMEGTRYSELEFEEDYGINPLVILITIAIPMAAAKYIPTEIDGKYSRTITLMFIFAALTILFKILSINQNLLGRMSFYFLNCYLILIPTTLYSIIKNRSLFYFIVTILCVIVFYMGTNGGTLKIDNYIFFWE